MTEKMFYEVKELLENNNLQNDHKELYKTISLIVESIELENKQQEIREKLTKLRNSEKK